MIINTGSRTDIPAFFSEWFYNRIREGYVLVRNPFNPVCVTRYRLDPEVVDALSFCTKNPEPMLDRIHELDRFRTIFMVTITPYGRDIEPGVPDRERVMEDFGKLSLYAGRDAVIWRYDPVILTEKYTAEYHKKTFREMAGKLKHWTDQAVVSFVDLYGKTRRNFPGIREVPFDVQRELVASFSETVQMLDMQIHLCHEDSGLACSHVDADGCLSRKVVEKAIGKHLDVPHTPSARQGCSCLLGADIGAYNSCGHGCLYCYANEDRALVRKNLLFHDPKSPLLLGHLSRDDVVRDAVQKSWIDEQMTIFDFLT